MLKKIIIGLIVLAFIIIQFIRPERNLSNDMSYDISVKYPIPADVATILKEACYDCHSNLTEYPWYFHIQPVAWWMNGHIVNGRQHLNFSDYTRFPVAVQYRRFNGIIEHVEEKEMPIPSYTWLGMHKDANLTDNQREILINWAKVQMDTLKATYPADSLVMRRRQREQPGM
jgi:hypothetical protein